MRRSNQEVDAIDIGLEMGMGRVIATMSMPFMWFTPATVDPYSPVTIMIVETLQNKLWKMGIANRKDGFVDPATSAALQRIVGPRWKNVAWIQIYSQIIDAEKLGIKHKDIPMAYTLGADLIGPELPPDWNTVAGVCRPQTPQMLKIFTTLQNQVNRVLYAIGAVTIGVDGRIGKQTVSAVNKALGANYKSCDAVAKVADMLSEKARLKANAASAPAVAKSPPPKQPASVPLPDGTVANPPVPFTDKAINFASSPIGLAFIGVGVFGAMRYRSKGKLF